MKRQFFVIDKTTGQSPDMEEIALREKWADGLIYCDMEGFAVGGDGSLYLLDECGAYRSCPEDRFEIVWANAPRQPEPASGDRLNADVGTEVDR